MFNQKPTPITPEQKFFDAVAEYLRIKDCPLPGLNPIELYQYRFNQAQFITVKACETVIGEKQLEQFNSGKKDKDA